MLKNTAGKLTESFICDDLKTDIIIRYEPDIYLNIRRHTDCQMITSKVVLVISPPSRNRRES